MANSGALYSRLPGVSGGFREIYLLDPESWAVLEAHGPLRAGVGRLFRVVCGPTPGDAIYVGVDRRRVFDALAEFPLCHLRSGDGPSGGERAVIEAVDLRHAAHRFDGLTIGSGDHEFVGVADEAGRLGLRVRVVSWSSRLSADLADAASEVVLLDHFLPAGPRAISDRERCWRGAGELPSNLVEAA